MEDDSKQVNWTSPRNQRPRNWAEAHGWPLSLDAPQYYYHLTERGDSANGYAWEGPFASEDEAYAAARQERITIALEAEAD